MSTFQVITVIIQTLTFIAVTISIFYYNSRQANTAKQALKRTTYINLESSVFELSKQLVAHSEVRPFIYGNKPVPEEGTELYNKTIAFCVFYLDFFDHVLTYEQMVKPKNSFPEWDDWIKNLFTNSPTLCYVYEKDRAWYIGKLEELYKESQLNKESKGEII